MTGNDTNAKGTTMNATKTKTKTQWIVMKDGSEVLRCKNKRQAKVIAVHIGGYVHLYRKEWA